MTSAVFHLHQPLRQDTSVVFASPHSGRAYPPEFVLQSQLDAQMLRSSEDAFVDDLFAIAPSHGAPLLLAQVPRAFLDLNRAADELDPAVIEGITRAPHNPRVSSGLGVIPRVVSGGRLIYRGKLPMAEAAHRITHFWHPYHNALRQIIDQTHARFGEAVLIDCHSMPREALDGNLRQGQRRPEVVLGDRFGAAAGADVVDQIEAAFLRAGFIVARNAPFAGAYIAQTYGRPTGRRHVVQVEIDRSLYMNEAQVAPLPEFAAFKARIAAVVADLTAIGRPARALAAE